MGQFFEELKRRNVFRVAIAYVIVAWLILQVGDALAPALRLPDWVNTLLAFFLILGLPIALIFAWAFELTPEGLKREKDVDRSESITHITGRKFDFIIIGTMAVALIYFAGTHDWSSKQGSVEPGEITSIAVLPLDNLMNDPQQDYFVDGMHEALITELSKIRALKIISRTSAVRYRNTEKSVPEIAFELGVDAIVEGSVLRAGNTVRVTAQLIDARSDHHLWADNFDRELSDILALHSDLAESIVSEISVVVTPEEELRIANFASVNPEVYELYLKGRYLCQKWTPEEMATAIRYLQQAIERDPGYAPAYAELAMCYTDSSFFEYLPPLEVYPKATAAAVRALEIDDGLAEAHTALAAVYYQMDWKFLEAEKAFKRAIELNPNNSRTLIYYAWMLGEIGRFEEAMVPARRAQELDPFSVSANVAVAEAFYLGRKYDEAIKEYSKNLDLDPNDPGAHYFLAWPYEQKGMFEKAIVLLEKAAMLSEGAPVHLAALGHTKALAGKRDEALKILEQLQNSSAPLPPSSFHIALVHIGLGNDDRAFQLLEDAFRERAYHFIYLNSDPKFDRLRSDPRFDDLLHMMEPEQ
jgi:TolB-like protein/Flp pilus assembly protein TadD